MSQFFSNSPSSPNFLTPTFVPLLSHLQLLQHGAAVVDAAEYAYMKI